MIGSLCTILNKFYGEYKITTPKKLKLVDAYLFCVMLTGIIQFAYCGLVGTFPFNSFLSGFISTVGCFVLGGKKKLLFLLVSKNLQKFFYSSIISHSNQQRKPKCFQKHKSRTCIC
jgi:hypothetical protein